MVFIAADTIAENSIYTIKKAKKTNKTIVLWIRIKDLNEKFGMKSIFDSVDKEIKGKFENCPTKEQIKKYKKHGSEFSKDLDFFMHMKIL